MQLIIIMGGSVGNAIPEPPEATVMPVPLLTALLSIGDSATEGIAVKFERYSASQL